MTGLQLQSLSGELKKVPAHQHTQPVRSIVDPDTKLGPWKNYWIKYYRTEFSFHKHYHELPLKVLRRFSFDEICKMKYSSTFYMDGDVEKLFETDPNYEIPRKIMSSMWRWGYGRGTWNEVVDTYEHIRHFSFIDNSDFEIRLDHTTHYNEHGYSKYGQTYIDGVFAFLVYYKKEHVMTIGFSIMEGKRLLIQQVQSAKRTGNRCLYRLPQNRMEFVISLFYENFPGYQLYLIDGKCLAQKTIVNYQNRLESVREICLSYKHFQSESEFDKQEFDRCFRKKRKDRIFFEERISHIEMDMPRLEAFYNNTGSFTLDSKPKTVNGFVHYQVLN